MKHLTFFRPGDFDDNGLLKAPVLFWVGLVVLARAWWLAGLMAMMAPAGNIQAGFLWPDIRLQLVALAAGIPGMVMLFIYPLRGRLPRLSRVNYALILAAIVVMAVTDLTGLMIASPGGWDAGWLFLCLDMAGGVMLWPDLWLRAVFFDPFRQKHRVMRNGR
ncbi:DUF2919 family protein [Salmonella enterica]|uniref:DUF2919 domain-containing protein n=2 Tax=Salmonella enterica TaxID=28901 RepID=A0A5U8AFN1_SALER|nr:DUF2919 family protein [Salmonella enterica]EBG5173043.1 DUF2919 domain-containing protein [Salmonella enterica subsp. enterica serovar Panama]ECC2870004.1 DUF2919 family protein [Salmonella enterica subsp. enterica serovar Tanger]ECO0976372.1 DUF2919 domain-containing protein [Salmonella enterica subsp. enterica serovar Newport]EDU8781512.1 DUF2919 domain-containing protein [Salmonella enterica subsp. enterica]EEE0665840.1 DUF2919 domain-containing protein [Salmonella enterica subsp. enter